MAQFDLDVVRGTALRMKRLERGLTVAKLSKLSSVSRKHIQDAEKGRNISCEILKNLARALDMKQIIFGDGLEVSFWRVRDIDARSVLERVAEEATQILALVAQYQKAPLGVGVTVMDGPPADTELRQLLTGLQEHVRNHPPTPADRKSLERVLDALSDVERERATQSATSAANVPKRPRRNAN
jgi:transcriptional regulator with XRE-family HTH domain